MHLIPLIDGNCGTVEATDFAQPWAATTASNTRVRYDAKTNSRGHFLEGKDMSGPIVRTGTNPKFWEGWDKAFGSKTGTNKSSEKKAAAPKAAAKVAEAEAKPATKQAPGKKSAKKKA
jgi:hypothetical protein